MAKLTVMRMVATVFAVIVLAGDVLCEVVLKGVANHEFRTDFVRGAAANPDSLHEVTIAVNQKNLDALKSLLYDVSTPSSLNFGKHKSFQEVGRMVENREGTASVVAWLKANGAEILSKSSFGEYVTARAPISTWESMLSTTFHEFSVNGQFAELHKRSIKMQTKKVFRAHEYSLPKDIATHVHSVFNVLTLPVPTMAGPKITTETMNANIKEISPSSGDSSLASSAEEQPLSSAAHVNSESGSGSGWSLGDWLLTLVQPTFDHLSRVINSAADIVNMKFSGHQGGVNAFVSTMANKVYPPVTPAGIKRAYGISGSQSGLGSHSVFGSLGQIFSPSDLSQFQSANNLKSEPVANIVGTSTSDSASLCTADSIGFGNCGEATLDVQYLTGISEGISTTYWYTPDSSSLFLYWIGNVSSTPNPPLVHTISYGSYEIFEDPTEMASFNTEAMKLGVQGVTITASTGDDGVAGFLIGPYYTVKSCGYYASWPASSPYVTAVGATMGGMESSGTASAEVACESDKGSLITTGGGFSNSLAAPAFQTKAVSHYFSTISPSPKQSLVQPFVKTNRAYPDVSMAGNLFEIVLGGSVFEVSGTSASSPVFAAVVSLINSHRLAAGMSTVGWMNPAIYANNGGFTRDVKVGNNRCTHNPRVCCSGGFTAAAGWDPVSGFGSIDFAKLSQYYSTAVPGGGTKISHPTTKPTRRPVGH